MPLANEHRAALRRLCALPALREVLLEGNDPPTVEGTTRKLLATKNPFVPVLPPETMQEVAEFLTETLSPGE